ncbi:hypothetical protein HDU76_000057 [Blyttiomyces sp. JEL0837]|nr:hypothetical protein HDU76_000057 [Blyttiomyces sp. JEL0837]
MDDDGLDIVDQEMDDTGDASGNAIHSLSGQSQLKPLICNRSLSDQVPGLLTDDMDPESRALIESMLAEEQLMIERSQSQSTSTSKAAKQPRPLKSLNDPPAKRVKTESKPSTKQAKGKVTVIRWTPEEDEKLRDGIRIYGYGSWTQIANHVGSRNSYGVKSRARHLAELGDTVDGIPLKQFTGAVKQSSPSTLHNQSVSGFVASATFTQQHATVDADDELIEDDFVETKVQSQEARNQSLPMASVPGRVSVVANDPASAIPAEVKTVLIHGQTDDMGDLDILEGNDDMGSLKTPLPEDHVTDARNISSHARSRTANLDSEANARTSDSNEKKQQLMESNIDLNSNPQSLEKPSTQPQNTNPSQSPTTLDFQNQNNETIEEPTLLLDPETPHPLEIRGCPEFFTLESSLPSNITLPPTTSKSKSSNKTAARYLKIRNHILECWESVRPKYLTKTKVRPGLKGEGDVNAISRVHEFLERIGCINFGKGLEGKRVVKTGTVGSSSGAGGGAAGGIAEGWDEDGWGLIADLARQDARRRNKKVRNQNGDWVHPSELRDGRVIVHGEDGRPLSDDGDDLKYQDLQEERRLLAKNAKYFADSELEKHDPNLIKTKQRQLQRQFYHYGESGDDPNDPFRLIPLQSQESSKEVAPFRVVVESNVQVIMDFHSHLAETEIIGLLGGSYDASMGILYVDEVFPCKSVSTGIQCEMDPESEYQAHIHFASQDKIVVGWYHSHPTFDPNPSRRDIETQTDHQKLFAREVNKSGGGNDGGVVVEPFVGVIFSPFDGRVEGVRSRVAWLRLGRGLMEGGKFRTPFACEVEVRPSPRLDKKLFIALATLITEFKDYEFKTELHLPYRKSDPSFTRIDKLMGSLISFASDSAEGEAGARVLGARVRTLLMRDFCVDTRSKGADNDE